MCCVDCGGFLDLFFVRHLGMRMAPLALYLEKYAVASRYVPSN